MTNPPEAPTTSANPALAALAASSTALLVIDAQNAFLHSEGTMGVSGVPMAPLQATIEPCRRLVEACQAASVPVVWTVQEHFQHDATRRRKRLQSHTAKRKRVAAAVGTWDAELVDELKPYAGDPALVVHKHRFGGFHETRLDKLLQMLGVDTLLVCGVSANACIETTLREAYMRDYDLVAVSDGIAAVRPEWDDVARSVWAHYLCAFATSDELIAWVADAARGSVARVEQLELTTPDLAAAERFYVEQLGCSVARRERGAGGAERVVTRQGIALVERAPGDGGGSGALARVVLRADRLDALAERLGAAGVEVARVERAEGEADGDVRYALSDPDGNGVELVGSAGKDGA